MRMCKTLCSQKVHYFTRSILWKNVLVPVSLVHAVAPDAVELYSAAWGTVAALDVEFSHFVDSNGASQVYPAQVAIVSIDEELVYHSLISPPVEASLHTYVGGVPCQQLAQASLLADVQKELMSTLRQIDILVGYSLQDDLNKLGVAISRANCRCLLMYEKFRTRRGAYRKLKDAARYFSGRQIQEQPGRHDAVEDAKATMALFRDHIMADASQLSEDDLEKHAFFELLAESQSA